MGTLGSISSINSGSGIDVETTVNQLLAIERRPISLLQTQQQKFDVQTAVLNDLNAKLLDLKTKVNALKDLSGKFNTKVATSSQPSILGATVSATAAAGNHTVTVSSLATTSSYYTSQLADGATTFAAGTFNIQVGAGTAVTVTVDSTNNTLDGLAGSINSLDAGVTASVITDANGARLSFVSNTSGAPGDLAITNNTTGLSFTKAITGTNAALIVDGVPVSSTSNSIGTVIPGVTLNLVSAAPGTTVAVSVQADTEASRGAIDDFVTSYNALVKSINAQFVYNTGLQQGGALAGNSSLRFVQQQVLGSIGYSTTDNNGFGSLASIGITVENDGTLTVDGGTLDDALTTNYADVKNLFQSTTPAGFAVSLASSLNLLTDTTNGAFNIEIKGVADSRTAITDQIDAMEDRLSTRREQLIAQFSRIDAALRQMPLLLSQISSQLGSLSSSR